MILLFYTEFLEDFLELKVFFFLDPTTMMVINVNRSTGVIYIGFDQQNLISDLFTDASRLVQPTPFFFSLFGCKAFLIENLL